MVPNKYKKRSKAPNAADLVAADLKRWNASTANQIASRTGLNRATVLNILKTRTIFTLVPGILPKKWILLCND